VELRRDRLRAARLRRFLTQQQLAEKAGTSKANISRLESGEQKARMSTVLRLAAALDVPPEELVAWETEDDASETGKAAA
jgi:transcriptional regulator with XRE-family HTH domain